MQKDFKNEYILDVDAVTEAYNKAHPKLKQLGRSDISERIEAPLQLLSDWKTGTKKTPKWVKRMAILSDLAGIKIDFIKKVE